MGSLKNICLFWHTVRHLKPVQIYGRLWHALYRPRRPVLSFPAIRIPAHPVATFIRKSQRIVSRNRFRFLNQEHDILKISDWNDSTRDKLWLYNLHYFDYLNDENAEKSAVIGRQFIMRWIRENPPFKGNGWESYPLSLRIVNWIKWFFSGNEPSSEFIESLYLQSWYLRRKVEYHLQGNHLIANCKGLIFAGLFFESAEAAEWLNTGIGLLRREMEEQIFEDGGHYERSPMYHSIILEDFLDIANLLLAYGSTAGSGEEIRKHLIEKIGRMMFWLKMVCHPDNKISFFNDAAFAVAPDPGEIEAYAARLNLPAADSPHDGLTLLSDSGYARMQRGKTVLIVDIGEIGPTHVCGHAHADTLSFEASYNGQRIFVNSGTSCYGTGKERLRQRGTAAHNTLVIDGRDSSEVWHGFRVARRAYPGKTRKETGSELFLACSHDGYLRLQGNSIHEREWRLTDTYFEITDNIRGSFSEAAVYYHLHPDIIVDTNNKALRSDGLQLFYDTDAELLVEKGSYHPEFGRTIPNQCLILKPVKHSCRMKVTRQ